MHDSRGGTPSIAPVSIRPFQVRADWFRLVDLDLKTTVANFDGIEWAQWHRNHPNAQIFFIEYFGEPVGYYAIELREDREIGVVYKLAVRPDYREQGFGYALIKHAEVNLRKAGFQKVHVLVPELDMVASPWLIDKGYRAVGVVDKTHTAYGLTLDTYVFEGVIGVKNQQASGRTNIVGFVEPRTVIPLIRTTRSDPGGNGKRGSNGDPGLHPGPRGDSTG